MANERARELRKNMTRQEVVLWTKLRELRLLGWHFRRQDPQPPFIADFVCRRARLVIEVDGGQHNEDGHAARDRRRDARLARDGYRTLRFWNVEVDRNLDGVMEAIWAALDQQGTG